jgi:hypothetical protein
VEFELRPSLHSAASKIRSWKFNVQRSTPPACILTVFWEHLDVKRLSPVEALLPPKSTQNVFAIMFRLTSLIYFWMVVCAISVLPNADVSAATVWDGLTIGFTNVSGSDPTLPASQDRMTDNVWITRGTLQGIYNAKSETTYTKLSSPAGTEWAIGLLANHGSLTYTTWEGLFGGGGRPGPADLLGKDLVVHLKTNDIYLAVKFVSWGGSLGGFAYLRSTPTASPTPPAPLLTLPTVLGDGSIRFAFTNQPGLTFSVLTASNLNAPLGNWTLAGSATEGPAGQYQFTDVGAVTNASVRFYRVRWP